MNRESHKQNMPKHCQISAAHGSSASDPGRDSSNSSCAVTAEPLHLTGELNTREGFALIVGNCLRQLQANRAGVIRGHDTESIHQMRIGLRRLRSALRLFRKWTKAPRAVRHELRWLNEVLGAARDSDVLYDETLPAVIAKCPSELALRKLIKSAHEIASANRTTAGLAVASARFASLMSDLAQWLEAGQRQLEHDDRRPDFSEPLRRTSRRMLIKQHRGLISQGKQLERATSETRHRIRIEARNLRYAVECFRSMYPAKATSLYLRRLATLQDALGQMNDAAVARRLLRRMGQDQPELVAAASFARRYLRASASPGKASIDRLWRRFREVKLF